MIIVFLPNADLAINFLFRIFTIFPFDFSSTSDRIVALGNHHDAWVFGGVDPNSGTAVMLDIVRSMALAVKQGDD